MSKTFTSRPSVLSRGRGASTSSRGRAAQFGEPHSPSSDRNPASTTTSRVSARGKGRSRGARMDNQGYPSRRPPGYRNGARADGAYGDSNPPQNDVSPETQTNSDQRGQYAGGYTVFSPNERKRQQISQVAQRETQAYEQYKQANAQRNFSYVGTVGGGEMNQEQVRARQANDVRAQKFNRLMRQQETRDARKKAEEKEIQEKKAEARRKAEQNSIRSSQRDAPAEEVRRKREAFLRQLETKSSESELPPSQQSTSSLTRNVSHAQKKKSQPHQSKTAPAGFLSQPSAVKVNNKNLTESKLNDERSVFSKNTRPVFSQSSSEPIKSSETGSADAGHGVEVYDDLSTLTSMFPNLDTSYLSDLLLQLGSVDEVVSCLM